MPLVRFAIDGLTCAAEAMRLERRLTAVPGVQRVRVNPINENAYVEFDPALTSPVEIVDAIEAAGFGARELAQR